jgi:hypothetical protein
MAEIISGALTTSETDSIKTETKAINLVTDSIASNILGGLYDEIQLDEIVETPDEYAHWVTFGIGGPA